MSKVIKAVLGALLLIALIALPGWVNPYILQICILTITYSMLGVSFTFTLKVGLPRFDIVAWWGVGAYTTALMMKKAAISFWPTILCGGIIAVVLGYLIYMIAIPRGMMVFLLFGMVTSMAMQQMFGSLHFFGGWGGTGLVPRPTLGSFTFMNKPELYYLGLVFLAVNLLVYHALYKSRIGRAWNAIGSSMNLAGSVGVDVVKYRMANVLIGNFFLAMAGSYYVAYSLVAVPSTFSFHNSVYVMMYVVIGGIAHSLSGPLIGAAILTLVPEYLRVAEQYEPIITAVTIILIIIFMPNGVLGLIENRIWSWVVSKRRAFTPDRGERSNSSALVNEDVVKTGGE